MRSVLEYKIHATKQGVCEVMRMNFVVYAIVTTHDNAFSSLYFNAEEYVSCASSIYSATLPSSLSIVAHKRLSQLASVAAISFQCPVSSLVQLEDWVI